MDNNYLSNIFEQLDRRAIENGRRYYSRLMYGISEPVAGFVPKYNKKADVRFVNIAGTEKIGGVVSKDTNSILDVYAGSNKVEIEMPAVGATYVESEDTVAQGNSILEIVTPQILDDLSRSADQVMYMQYHNLAVNGQVAKTYTKGTTDSMDILAWFAEEIDQTKDSNMDRVTMLLSNKLTNLLLTQRVGTTEKMIMDVIREYARSLGVRQLDFVQALPDTASTAKAIFINYDYTAAFEGLEPVYERSVPDLKKRDITHMYLMAPTVVKQKVDNMSTVRELTVTIA